MDQDKYKDALPYVHIDKAMEYLAAAERQSADFNRNTRLAELHLMMANTKMLGRQRL